MRRALLLVVLVACSKGENKSAPGADPSAGSEPSGGGPGTKEKTVKGTLTFGGAIAGTATWKPDLALSCGCINENNWTVDTTLSGEGDMAVAITVSSNNGIKLTGGKIIEIARSEGKAGITGSCKPDNRNTDGVIAFDLDAKVTGKDGEVTIKGHLDVVCREGL